MIILGIDPGTATTGYGVVKKEGRRLSCVAYGVIETPKGMPSQDRLLMLERQLVLVIKKHAPGLISVERLFFLNNAKTAFPVSEARGVILLACAKHGIPIREFTPLQAKMAITGYGKAQKAQVQRMVQETLKLKELPKPDDAADALGLAIAGCFGG
ncbi:MAG: crossover junction endodeoxyribonuclease RuvC [Candidatus Wildermuthbacteria bacterium]|nr:crossover junction endodeoxyribonuclease RuvC [Candidatus Wildermuthbacteria bacterium]